MKPEFTKLSPPERCRTYIFPDDVKVDILNVSAVAVSKSGTHRIETVSGEKYIIPPGWIAIKLDMDDWTF
jgi:hypothetical protein